MLQKARKLFIHPIKQAKKSSITLDGNSLTLEDLAILGSGKSKVVLTDDTWSKLAKTREVVERLANNDEPVYGINTGFGRFSSVKIPYDNLKEL